MGIRLLFEGERFEGGASWNSRIRAAGRAGGPGAGVGYGPTPAFQAPA